MNEKVKKEHKSIGVYEIHTLKNGKKSYKKQLRLGVDHLTGKDVITTVSGKNFEELRLKCERKKKEFEASGSTLKKNTDIKTFRQLTEFWWEDYKGDIKANSRRRFQGMIDTYLIPELGDYLLVKMTPLLLKQTLKRWMENAKKPSPMKIQEQGNGKDYRDRFYMTKKILEFGVTLELIPTNPAGKIKVPRKEAEAKGGTIKYYTKSQLQTLLREMEASKVKTPQMDSAYRVEFKKLFFHVLAYTGARNGEILALDWNDVDFENKTLSISKTLNNYMEIESTPKTVSSIRILTLDEATVQKLRVWKAFQGRARLQMGLKKAVLVCENLMTQKPFSPVSLRQFLQSRCERLDIPYIGLHGFRHTHASLLLNAGVGYKEIQQRLGHESIEITMNTYSHLYQETKEEVADRLAAYLLG